jgi:hypothetical protein
MSVPRFIRKWLYRPSWIALLLGLGALSAGDADAGATATRENGTAAEDLRIRVQDGQVYISENGGSYRQLRLGQSTETRALIQLLDADGSITVDARSQAIILAGSGGAGFHWAPADKRDDRGARDTSMSPPAEKTVAPGIPDPRRRNAPPKAPSRSNG